MNSNTIDEEVLMNYMELIEKIMIEKYGKVVVEHAKNPRNNHQIKDANGYTSYTGPCGDTMQIWLKVINDVIEDISFRSSGCDITNAVGSMVTELAKGKRISEALQITPIQIVNELGGRLPDDHSHCALLAKDALSKAIANYNEKKLSNYGGAL